MKLAIAFCTTTHWLSGVIRWFTGSKVSHVVVTFDLDGLPMVCHADMGGVRFVTRDRFLATNHQVVEEWAHVEELTLTEIEASLGVGYDYAALFGEIPVMLARWLGKKIRNPFNSPSHLYCTELVLKLGTPELNALDPDTATPEDILDVCRASEKWSRLKEGPS